MIEDRIMEVGDVCELCEDAIDVGERVVAVRDGEQHWCVRCAREVRDGLLDARLGPDLRVV